MDLCLKMWTSSSDVYHHVDKVILLDDALENLHDDVEENLAVV
jgi:hypothetical protein